MTTTLYRPVPIETVEQLEALPDGTILRGWTAGRYTRAVGYIDRGPSGNRAVVGVDQWPARRVLDHGFAALVPVEAEEERYTVQLPGQTVPHDRARLVTPWEPT